MGSKWESDPLFSAAEVVQDSADRMESLFRLLLHDQSLLQGDHPDHRLLTSIQYHKRDLATILETAKWQLEDFERAVNSLAMQDKSRTREDGTFRHRQFIRAIREQINHVEKSVDGPSKGGSMINVEWVDLNEQDRDGLALFLIGGNATEHSNHQEVEETSILRRFLDPTSASSLTDNEIIEHESGEFEKYKLSRDVQMNHCPLKDENSIMLASDYSTRLGSDLQGVSCNRAGDGNHWDLEAHVATPKNVFHETKSKGFYSRINFGFLSNLWTMCGSKVTKSYIKRLKDGEEQRHSPTYIDVPFIAQGQHMGPRLGCRGRSLAGLCSAFRANLMVLGSSLEAQYQRFPRVIQVNQHTVQLIFTIIFALVVFGIVVSKIT
ncbi:uncharacterized protein LOC126677632 [Mercurialis annua]|uniref:uncharacterized protein LOC126677632 n=1 Tax=Mercurialis annua TaxID=3986 RepID=UPI00215F6446|nr:uncharacterized protein LOC126677632 [Mercurialis annua]XP_050228307.1 uncharacterized protein LOC126677632 [Mercurialis annua]